MAINQHPTRFRKPSNARGLGHIRSFNGDQPITYSPADFAKNYAETTCKVSVRQEDPRYDPAKDPDTLGKQENLQLIGIERNIELSVHGNHKSAHFRVTEEYMPLNRRNGKYSKILKG